MKENDINLKELWLGQKVGNPDLKELLTRLKHYKSKSLQKLIITNILLLLTCAVIGFMWYYYQPRLITTKLGIILGILAMVIFLLAYNKLIPFFLRINNSLSNREYIRNLISLKEKEKFLQSSMLGAYLILLGLGLCFYMYEYVMKLSWPVEIGLYILVLIWIAFNWFFIRPKKIRNSQKRLNDLINALEDYERQLKHVGENLE